MRKTDLHDQKEIVFLVIERTRSNPKGIDTDRSRRSGVIYTNTIMSVSVQMHTTTPFTLSAADEALAVRLELDDDAAWRDLLGRVEPTFGDPVAAQVAAIMRRRMQDGVEYRDMGDMIRQMLHTKAVDEIYGNDSEDEEENAYQEWLAKRDQWLRKQSKETLVKMVLMDDMEKETYIEKHMDDSEAE